MKDTVLSVLFNRRFTHTSYSFLWMFVPRGKTFCRGKMLLPQELRRQGFCLLVVWTVHPVDLFNCRSEVRVKLMSGLFHNRFTDARLQVAP